MTIVLEDNGDTTMTGPIVGQAALHGMEKKVRDLGMPLLSVNRVGDDNTLKVPRWTALNSDVPRTS